VIGSSSRAYLGAIGGVGDGRAEDENDAGDGEAGRQTRRAKMEARLTALNVRPNLYELLPRSLAPSISEMET